MPVDSKTVGVNERLIQILGDPTASSQLSSVLGLGDAAGLAGLYALLTQNIGVLLNSGGTYDRMRSALGATGILAVNAEGTKATYRACSTGLVTVTGATDIFQIAGSASKTIRVTRIVVAGTIQTAGQYVDIQVIKRSTVDTGGTSTAPTAVLLDANDAAATAALLQYTANPTLGTSVGVIGVRRVFAALTGTAALFSDPAVFEFGNRPGARAAVLRGTAQALCVNLNAPGNPGTFDIECEWTEES